MKSPAARACYDHTRALADAASARAQLVWLSLLLGATGLMLMAIGLALGDRSLYVHPELAHAAMLPIHWR